MIDSYTQVLTITRKSNRHYVEFMMDVEESDDIYYSMMVEIEDSSSAVVSRYIDDEEAEESYTTNVKLLGNIFIIGVDLCDEDLYRGEDTVTASCFEGYLLIDSITLLAGFITADDYDESNLVNAFKMFNY